MNSDSIIQPDGSMRIVVHQKDVSWFDFLRHFRACTARDSGWKSQTHWTSRGVERLTPDIATLWTRHSLDPSTEPSPRQRDFMLDRTHSAERMALLDLGDEDIPVSENALSFRTFQRHHRAEGEGRFLGTIDLVGYEVPLAQTKGGQLRVDLLGVSSDPVPALELIELKDRDNTRDSPLMALTEVICYALQILRLKDAMFGELRAVRPLVSERCFERINLRVMAPKEYWQLWFRDPSRRAGQEKSMAQIVDGVNAGVVSSGYPSPTSLHVSFSDI